MNKTPMPDKADPSLLPDLRFLKLLVTVLAGTMIAGLITIVALLVIRLPNMTAPAPSVPGAVTLPDGTVAEAVTIGRGWYAVVSRDQEILIFDAETGKLRQRVQITTGD